MVNKVVYIHPCI